MTASEMVATAAALCMLTACETTPEVQVHVFTAQGNARWGEAASNAEHRLAFAYASRQPLKCVKLTLNRRPAEWSLRSMFGHEEADRGEPGWTLDTAVTEDLAPGVVYVWDLAQFKSDNKASFDVCRLITSVDIEYGTKGRGHVRLEFPLQLPTPTALDIETACYHPAEGAK